ncbi:hypothetical protein [Ottowia sp.]|uniref:hypothetical protein n=1 Tax=Ottowia sp. TaxID=1898956 RepID=UPI002633B58D|nr:hypothetical protein [Ottowia sp.]
MKRRFQKLCWALAGLLAASGAAQAQGVLRAEQPKTPRNTLLAALDNVGLRQCRPAFERLTNLALDGVRGNDVLLDWDRRKKDSSPIFTLIGLDYPNGGAAFSMTAIPNDKGECSISAERISAAPVACNALAQQELVGYRMTRLLPTMAVYVDPKDDSASTVSLIDSPPGCLVIRRYVSFNWTPPPVSSPR